MVQVHVVWHPGDVDDGKDALTMPLPTQLFRLLHTDPALVAGERAGMPVFFHTSAAGPDGTVDVPPDVPLTDGQASLVVVLVGNSICNSSSWLDWLAALRRQMETSAAWRFLPVGLVPRAVQQGRTLGEIAAERAFDEADPVERDRLVRIAVLRTLVDILTGGQRIKPFVSHAKADGRRVAMVLAQCIDDLKAESWIDAERISGGDNFHSVLRDAVENRKDQNVVFVAVVSDAYATREWCRWEAQVAKESGLAMVVLDMVTEGQRRSLPALGNVPVIRFNPPAIADDGAKPSKEAITACRRVFEAVLLERINGLCFTQRVTRMVARFGHTPDRWVYFSPAPDLITLLSRDDDLRGAVYGVYPDPPLPPIEKDLLAEAARGTRLTTPLSLVASLATGSAPDVMAATRPVRVALSISRSPAEELRRLTLGTDHIDALLLALGRFTLASGHTIMFGGAPGHDLTDVLSDVERTHRFGHPDERQRLENYVAGYIHRSSGFGEGLDDTMRLITVDSAPTIEGELGAALAPLNDLTVMRHRMTAECDVRIIAAGDLTPGKVGTRRGPGVLEEAYLALRANKPVIVIGGFGGAGRLAADALLGRLDDAEVNALRAHFASQEMLTTTPDQFSFDDMLSAFNPDSELRNGLSVEHSFALALSNDIDEIGALTALALHQIARR